VPQPSVFRALRPSDKQFTPVQSFKSYIVSPTNYSGSGYGLYHGIHSKNTPALYSPFTANDPVNSYDGSNKYIIWNAVDHRYYRYPYDAARSIELTNRRTVDKFLFYSSSLLSLPYFELGERVKAGSVNIQRSVVSYPEYDFTLQDDGNGNLRDALIDSSSFANRKKLTGYWTFNNEFRKFNNGFGTITNGEISFDSRLFTPEFDSYIKNIGIVPGIEMSYTPTPTTINSGLAGAFGVNGTSFIRTGHISDFDYSPVDDWTISFWINTPASSSHTTGHYATLISKRYEKEVTNYDIASSLLLTGVESTITGSVTELTLDETNRTKSKRYPFNIEIYQAASDLTKQGTIIASMGGTETVVTASIISSVHGSTTGSWHHVAVQHSSSIFKIYRDGVLAQSANTTGIGETRNKAKLLFGNPDSDSTRAISFGYSGSMAEIRFYDYACTNTELQSLANAHFISGSLYQTNVAGNVFYRNGHIVISSPVPKYHNTLLSGSFIGGHPNNWSASYRGTHTIYENMILCNVPKDVMNVSVNPTAVRQGYDSLRPDDFINGIIKPYITTIGLYNDRCQLLAVGKLGQPIQKRDDIDMNFIIKYDF